MATKRRFVNTLTLPDGKKVTRTGSRAYSHGWVICVNKVPDTWGFATSNQRALSALTTRVRAKWIDVQNATSFVGTCTCEEI